MTRDSPDGASEKRLRGRQPQEGLHIRRYEDRDKEVVWRLHVLGLEQMGANLGHGPWDDDLRDIEHAYLTDGDFLVGEFDGRVVAMGALRQVRPGVGEVKRLRVAEALQGQGFGEAMARAVEQRARELGFKRLIADTTVKQRPAQQLLAKLGFSETHRKVVRAPEIIFYERGLTQRGRSRMRCRRLGRGDRLRAWTCRRALESRPSLGRSR